MGDVTSVPLRYLSARTVARRTLQPDDILIETAGGTSDRPTGRTLLVTERMLRQFDRPASCASFARFLRVDPRLADPAYVFWYLQNLHDRGRMRQHEVRHTGVGRFQYTTFAATEVLHLPPMEEQRAISATLGALDDKIESNRRQQVAAELLLRAHVDRLVSGRQGAMTPLGAYCHLIKDGVAMDEINPGSNYIGFDHMPRGQIFLDEWGTAEGLGSNKWRFQAGDILFGKLRPYFKKVGIAPVDGLCSTDILTIRPVHRKDTALVAIVASTDALIDKVSAAATGTRMPRASWSDLAAWHLPDLRDDERDALAHVAQPLIERMTLLTHDTKRLIEIRDTLLPELLSRRIRVPEADRAAEAVIG